MAKIDPVEFAQWQQKTKLANAKDMARLQTIVDVPLTLEERSEILERKMDSKHLEFSEYEAALAYAAPGKKQTLCDIDGTNSDYVLDNSQVKVNPQAKKGLESVARIEGARVFAVSGGGLARSKGLFEAAGLGYLDVYGSNGIEQYTRQPDGSMQTSYHPDQAMAKGKIAQGAEVIKSMLRSNFGREDVVVPSGQGANVLAAQRHGYYEEEKGDSTAIHYVAATAEFPEDPEVTERLRKAAVEIVESPEVVALVKTIDPRLGLHVRSGNVEIGYNLGRNKGTVFQEQMVDSVAGLVEFDDTNDLQAAKVANDIRDNPSDERFAAAWDVYNAPNRPWPESPDAVILRADAIFQSPSELGKGMVQMTTMVAEINPQAILARNEFATEASLS